MHHAPTGRLAARLSMRHLLLATSAAISLAAPIGAANAQDAAVTTATTRSFNIPPQSLASALQQFTEQSGVQVGYTAALGTGVQSPGVSGTFAAPEALSRLLTGTGLTYRLTSANAVILERAPQSADGTVQLGPVRVEGDAGSGSSSRYTVAEETAVSHFTGFAATRTAASTKTDTPIVETPQSISIVGAEEIETLKAQNLQEALGYVAGVSRREGLDRTSDSVNIRGFQATADSGSMYRDGTKYSVNLYNGQQEPYGLERIEVLKGAASVLYGSAAPGGIINTISKRPTTTPFHELNVELGSFDRKQFSGDFSGPLDTEGTWSYRLTFLRRDSDTFIDYVPDDRTFIAPALKWQPSADTSLTFLADYQKDHTIYIDGLPAQGTVLPNINGRISRHRFTGEPDYDKFILERYSIGYLFEHSFSEALKVRNSLRYYHADNKYNYTWNWGLSSDQRESLFRGVNGPRFDRSSSLVSDTSLQYSVAHGAFQHTALLGIDYSRPRHESERYSRSVSNFDYYTPIYGSPLGTPTPNTGSSWKNRMERVGVYAQDQIKISGRLVVLLGGRYDFVKNDEREFFSDLKTADNEKSHSFTGRAGLVYLADNGLAPFLSYSESFEPTTGRDRVGNRFHPTTGQQFEAGIRFQPKGGQTLLSAAVYQLTRQNVTVTDPDDTNYMIQAGEVRSRGVEIEARTRIGSNTNLIAAYAYTDAKTIKAGPLRPQDVGQRPITVPKNTLSLWSDYSFADVGLSGLKLGAGVRYVDKTRGLAQGTEVTVPSFTLVDALASYSFDDWKLSVNATNLFDKIYVGSCTYACFYGEPRKVIGTLTYRW